MSKLGMAMRMRKGCLSEKCGAMISDISESMRIAKNIRMAIPRWYTFIWDGISGSISHHLSKILYFKTRLVHDYAETELCGGRVGAGY